MKTMQEWMREFGSSMEGTHIWVSKEGIKAIQRDAWEAGKTEGLGYALDQVRHAREEGETDMRQVRAWIEHNELKFPEDK
jgi:hypothetical protein